MLFNEVGFLDRFAAARARRLRRRRIPVSLRLRRSRRLPERLDEHGLDAGAAQPSRPATGPPASAASRAIPIAWRSSTTASTRAIEYATALGCTQLNCLAGIVPAGVEPGATRARRSSAICSCAARQSAGRRHPAADRADQHARHPRLLPAHAPRRRSRSSTRSGRTICSCSTTSTTCRSWKAIWRRRSRRTCRGSRTCRSPIRPARHEPGTGEINYDFLFELHRPHRLPGWIGCEYKPAGGTEAGLGWMTRRVGDSHEARSMSSDRLHRSRHHGQAHGPQPDQRRAHALLCTRAAACRRSSPPPAGTACTIGEGRRAASADVVITMVPDTPDVEQVLFGADGVAAGPDARQDRRRHELDLADRDQEVRAAHQRAGLRLPRRAGVGRRGRRAERGAHASWSAAPQPTFERVKPLFELMGKNITLVGGNGDGQTCKVANQIIVALNDRSGRRSAALRLEGRRRSGEGAAGA